MIEEMKTYSSEWWSIQFPEDWQAAGGESAVGFFSERGVGAVQVSAARNDNGPVTDADMREFAKEYLEVGAKMKDVICGDFTGFYFHFGTNDMYQRQWWLRHDDVMVLVTYTSAPEHKGIEDATVDRIVASLRRK
jgi:hypothetical protein